MNRLINLEGIDCSGKSTIGKKIAEKLTTPDRMWHYDHEPRFTSSEADSLNFNGLDPWQREFYFVKDRMAHQPFLRHENVILDRYILSGLAYAETFSPQVVPMMKSIYFMPEEFIRPDVIVLIDTPPEEALKFNELKKGTPDHNPKLTLNTLQTICNNFHKHKTTMLIWEIPVVVIKPTIGDIEATVSDVLERIKLYL